MTRLILVAALSASLSSLAGCDKKAAKPAATAAPVTAGTINPDGSRSIPIAVKKAGYEPATVTAKPGEQLRLVFTRVEKTECGAQVKVDNGKVFDLPMNQPVEIAVTAPASGKLGFACGMDMMAGVIVVGS